MVVLLLRPVFIDSFIAIAESEYGTISKNIGLPIGNKKQVGLDFQRKKNDKIKVN